jgi:D-glycero-alpha-D-manno-heptose-7-phosphate kinase
MIISRTPLRLCLVGGGTDVRDFYREEHGAVVTCALASYVYVLVNPRFDGRLRVSGIASEDCGSAADVRHPLVREALRSTGVAGGMDIAAFCEVPEGTGLGSSSALTVGLLNALAQYRNLRRDPRDAAQGAYAVAQDASALAQEACAIEIDRLGGNVGKLDQFSTALGGLLHIRFNPDETTTCRRIEASRETLRDLETRMMLFFTGQTHQASTVMSGWRRGMEQKRAVLRRMRDQSDEVTACLETGDVDSLGPILHEAWELKKTISEGISSPEIDAMYEAALRAGATGGKLSGAGGGGFLLVFCPPERQSGVRRALEHCREVPVRLEPGGTQIVFDDEHPELVT